MARHTAGCFPVKADSTALVAFEVLKSAGSVTDVVKLGGSVIKYPVTLASSGGTNHAAERPASDFFGFNSCRRAAEPRQSSPGTSPTTQQLETPNSGC
jgi:hypothetical protein